MELVSLKIENFQGVRSLEITLNGANASVYGDNATGKTTIANAFSWLLFGKSQADIKNFNPKPRDEEGEIHNLTIMVEAKVMIDDKGLTTLRKERTEKWTKKRGSDTSEYQGDTDSYFIDEVPVKMKDYTNFILQNVGTDDQVRLLTSVDYFPATMDWKKRREVLFELFEPVTDEEILRSSSSFDELKIALLKEDGSNYSVNELLDISKAQIRNLNKRIDQLPAMINEAKRAIPEGAENLSQSKLETELNNLKINGQQLYDEIADLKAGNQNDNTLTNRLAELEREKINLDLSLEQKIAKAREELMASKTKQLHELNSIDASISTAKYEVTLLEKKKETLTAERNKLRERYTEVRNRRFDSSKTVCPTCHRELEPEAIQEAINSFNLSKSKELEEINRKGSTEYSKEVFERLDKEIEAKNDIIKASESHREEVKFGISNITNHIEFKLRDDVIFATEYQATKNTLEKKIAGVKEAIANQTLNTSANIMIEAKKNKIKDIESKVLDVEEKLGVCKVYTAQTQRIEELKREQKAISKQFDQTEKIVSLCEKFITAKCQMVSSAINSHFENIRFRLFDTQINGAIKECCDVMIPSNGALVPYAFANNASKINAGLEVIQTLSNKYNKKLPIIVDNAESVTNLKEVDAQVIRLVVSEADKELRIEVD